MVVAGFDRVQDSRNEFRAEPVLFVDCGCGSSVQRLGFK
jgi:hypothetical protein